MSKMNKEVLRKIENILFSYKKYKKLNKNNEYNDFLSKVETSLEMIKECKNYEYIPLKYFRKMSYEEISEKLNIDVRNVYCARRNLLKQLEFHFSIQDLI